MGRAQLLTCWVNACLVLGWARQAAQAAQHDAWQPGQRLAWSPASPPEPPPAAPCVAHFRKDLPPVYGLCEGPRDAEPRVTSASRKASTDDVRRHVVPVSEEGCIPWIVLWANASATEAACYEAQLVNRGRFDGRCSAAYTNVFPGFAAQFSEADLLHFLEAYKDQVLSVHADTEVRIHSVERPAPWALDRLDQEHLPLDGAYHYTSLGSGVNVYVVDTGITPAHNEFRRIDGRPGTRATEVFTSLDSGSPNVDCNGHGTHVAACIAGLNFGVAKNATIRAVRSLECLGNGTVSQVIQGLDWVREHYEPPAVVVMALGGESQYALDLAVRDLVAAGVAVAVAAGNEDTDACSKSPAR